MRRDPLRRLILSALFLSLGLVLPFLTMQVPELGSALLPMHLPVLLCGALCGWMYALPVGAILPILRFALFGMPPIYPTGLSMSLELAAYGAVMGLCYCLVRGRRGRYSRVHVLLSLLASMLAGRAVWGMAQAVLLGAAGKPFGIQAFLAGAFLNAIPGILLQLLLVPLVIELAERMQHRSYSVDCVK
jgi:riboflavin transporter FmnP